MSKTRQTMVDDVRLLIQDTDESVSTDFTDAQITTFINYALMWWYENYERRVKLVTLVADWDSTEFSTDGDATCTYPEILNVFWVTSSEDFPLIEVDWSEIRYRQIVDTQTASVPTHYAKIKYGGAGVGAAAQNLWRFAVHPMPSGDNGVVKGLVRDYPVALSADADIVDLGVFEGNCVCIIAAMILAPRKGRPDLAADLSQMLPQLVRDKLETHMTRNEVKA